MVRVLNVAEKPSAAKEIVAVLRQGANVASRNGFSQYNRIFEFDMNLSGRHVRMVFTSVSGHLKCSDFEARYRKWGSCDPALLLDPTATRVEWSVMVDKQPLVRTLQTEARRADWLVLWLDCDSEGEKIAFDVRDVCLESRRNLVVKRARFSAMTRADLMRAVNSLEEPNALLAKMVETRQEIDLRAGSAYTRFLTHQLERFDLDILGEGRSIVSYGACQFPTLGLVVDRWLTIQNFVRRPFWVFDLKLVETDVPFEWARKQIFDEYSAHVLYELCVEQAQAEGSVAHVVRVQKRKKSRWRPLPLATVELQKAASRLLRMSSDRLMEVAESLYNKGLISYPRTETDRFNKSFDLKSLIQKQVSNPEWGSFAGRLFTPPTPDDVVTFMWPRAGPHDDGAHPPIHPTDSAPSSFDSEDHRKVYSYVTKRFLACCAVDAQGAETYVEVRVGSAEMFSARGLIIEHKGYLEVMHPFERWAEREMPTVLLQQGATIRFQSLLLRESKTQPPPLLQEADLIALMDHHGIGTDATIAEHIKKVQERNYVRKLLHEGGRFTPTEIGIALVIAHEKCQLHLARPHMRAKQERELKQVSAGQAEASTVLSTALTEYRLKFNQLRNNGNTINEVFQNRFNFSSAATWDTLIPQLSECGACHQRMDLKGSGSNFTSNSSSDAFGSRRGPGRGARGRGSNRGRSRGRGRGRGAHNSGGNGGDRSLHCSRCGTSHKLPRFGHLERHEKRCPICNFQVLQVTNAQTNSQHTLCPYCYSNPPQAESMNPEKKTAEFRCFSCANTSCELSGGTPSNQSNVAVCPRCSSICSIRESRNNSSTFISCSSGRECSFVYWFPREATQSISAVEDGSSCSRCNSRLIHISWRRSFVPLGTSTSFVGCIWCDTRYHDLLRSAGAERSIPQPPHPGTRIDQQRSHDIEDVPNRNPESRAGRSGNLNRLRQRR